MGSNLAGAGNTIAIASDFWEAAMALNHLGHPLHGTVQEHLVAPKKHGTLQRYRLLRSAGRPASADARWPICWWAALMNWIQKGPRGPAGIASLWRKSPRNIM